MFTGIIQHRGKVIDAVRTSAGARLGVDARGWAHSPSHGESIAVHGCCLTVFENDDGILRFDVIRQTLRSTTLGGLSAGAAVNLEEAVTPSTLLGGHIVQGHVDGVGVVRRVSTQDGEHRLHIEPPGALIEFVVDRGSIAVDGVSLTIASANEASFDVALIPTTLELTTLGELGEGSRVNLECDYLAKIVVQWMKRKGG